MKLFIKELRTNNLLLRKKTQGWSGNLSEGVINVLVKDSNIDKRVKIISRTFLNTVNLCNYNDK